MNGRLYDPVLGRFLQADPFVQAPDTPGSLNRYSYVLNNPLSYTDPSGFFFKKLVRGYMRVTGKQAALRWIGKQSYLSGVISAGLNFVPGCQVWCTAAFNASMTFVQTGSLNASLRTGAITAGASLAFQAIGAEYAGLSKAGGIAFGGNYLTAGQIAGQIITHAFVGGVSTALSGGKFGHGFVSAGVTKGLGGAFLPAGGDLPAIAYGTVVSALIGGTTSRLVGGKFANGAQTAAMQYVLNQVGEAAKREGWLQKTRHLGINRRFHAYSTETTVCDGGEPRCSLSLAAEGLLRHPAPGTSGLTLATTNAISHIEGFGSVSHIVDPDGLGVWNITLPNHTLYPGWVHRRVVQRGDSIVVTTYGEGTGNLAWINENLDWMVWGVPDQKIWTFINYPDYHPSNGQK